MGGVSEEEEEEKASLAVREVDLVVDDEGVVDDSGLLTKERSRI